MRLWSLHPRYLDRQGLTACWREALLAQAVLAGRTRGYRHHPQLRRFQDSPDPLLCVGSYLEFVAVEAAARGYRYDRARIDRAGAGAASIEVGAGQLDFEWAHLSRKLAGRSPEWLGMIGSPVPVLPHPLFTVVDGPTAEWEVT